jgi:hypothetical protein
MKAVWSFWTMPYFRPDGGWGPQWYSEWHHWLAWGISVYAAARHYPDTALFTDDVGARLLVDSLELPFRHVSTALNRLKREDPKWWSLGKIEAYRCQRVPFVHIDTDVFLWKPLRPDLEQADVLAQNPEHITPGLSYYRPEELESTIKSVRGGWLPEEWTAYRTGGVRAECCGVFGGNRVDFIKHYADAAMRLVASPRNRRALNALKGKPEHMVLVEQYLLSACIEYHRGRADSPYQDLKPRYVFDSIQDAYRPESAMEAGFSHVASSAKADPRVCADIEERVKRDLPRFYERCLRHAAARAESQPRARLRTGDSAPLSSRAQAAPL